MSPISIANAAAQFELYASVFDKDNVVSEARHKAYEDDATPEGRAIRWWETYQMAKWQACSHQLRFCAAFLRDHVALRWSDQVPTNDGFYWTRGGVGFPSWVAEVRHNGTRFELWQPGSKQPLALADLVGRQWAGPIERPSEPLDATPTPGAL